jgi:hypothetical protein
MVSRDPSDQGRLITVLDEAGWELAGCGRRGVPWLFRRGTQTRPIAAATLIEAVRLLLIQEEVIDHRDTSQSASPPAGLAEQPIPRP